MRISRRSLLLAPAAWLACGPRKAAGFRGYCLVADQDGPRRGGGGPDHLPPAAAHSRSMPRPLPCWRILPQPKAFVLAPDAGTVYEIDAASLAVSPPRARRQPPPSAMRLAPRKDAAVGALSRSRGAGRAAARNPASRAAASGSPRRPDNFDLGAATTGGRGLPPGARHRAGFARTQPRGSNHRRWTPSRPSCCSAPTAWRWWPAIGGERSLTIFDVATGKTMVRLPLPLEPRQFLRESGWRPGVPQRRRAWTRWRFYFLYDTEIWQTVLAGRAPGAMAARPTPSRLTCWWPIPTPTA